MPPALRPPADRHAHRPAPPGRHRRRRPTVRRTLALAVLALVAAVVPVGTARAATPATPAPPGTATGRPATAPRPHLIGVVSTYWLVASDGGVFSFGGARFFGSTGSLHLNRPVVGMAATPDSNGYWLVASDGGVFTFGDAGFYGSTGDLHLTRPVVGMTATADGRGYWLVASDGGLFAFGDARFYGSMGGRPLNQPIVAMAATPDGGGYWEVAADGGVFSFGDARFEGSTGSLHLSQPIVGMTTTEDGRGYWFTAADGGVFAFGDARFYGSLGGIPQPHPIVAVDATPDGQGYWFTNSNGAVTAEGDAVYWGSAPQTLSHPIVGMARALGSGHYAASGYPSGTFGYDVSYAQCGNLPPDPHTIGLVQVEEPGYVNPCLAQEAQWAGAGLNLYLYLNYGTATSSGDGGCARTASVPACNYGYDAAQTAFDDAQAAGVDALVPWWLDVEDASFLPTQTGANAAAVQGYLDGLHADGVNSVGIYASPGNWAALVGHYAPAVPYWAADWDIAPTTTCQDVQSLYPGLPTGPVQLVQYSSPSSPYPLGGMDASTYDDDYAC